MLFQDAYILLMLKEAKFKKWNSKSKQKNYHKLTDHPEHLPKTFHLNFKTFTLSQDLRIKLMHILL